MAQYDDELKQKAIAIAQEASPAEAAKATGIPAGTIRSWLHRLQRNDGALQRTATQRPAKNMRALQEEATERAIQQAGDYIAERLKGLADRLYSLAERAVGKVDLAINDVADLKDDDLKVLVEVFKSGTQDQCSVAREKFGLLAHDRDGAAWLRSLVGVLSQAIDKAQLLSGKPTARTQDVKRHEHVYDITQRIISDPESVDLANSLLQRAAGRNPSTYGLDRQRGSLDTI